MKKHTILFLFILCPFFIKAQSFIGFLSENYSGVHGIISNPANIVDSRFKVDINLAGFSAFGGNDYYGINIFDALKDGYNFDLESKKYPSNDNSGSGNVDFLGPSFMLNLSKNSAISIFTRGRLFVNANDINGASIASIEDDTTDDFIFNEGPINGVSHGWAELGITYAVVLINKRNHFLKGGMSLKYLKGLGSAYVVGENVTVDYDADGTDLGGGETTGSISSSGFINYARFAEFDNDNYDYKAPNNAKGFGVDLGFIYEWRPNYRDYKDSNNGVSFKHKNKYKLKLGLSITDVGYIDYKNGIREGYNILNSGVSEEEFDNADDMGDFLNSYYTLTASAIGYKIDLPTALHFNLDWSMSEKLYLNFNTDYSLASKNRKTVNLISNTISLIPRFESKWFSFYLPLSVIERNGFRVGAGLRAGPVYLGSGSIISAFSSNNNKQADVYAGLKIPIYQQDGQKDSDEDGVIDILDDCPKIPGTVENNGCPLEDRDGDSVSDYEDACPDVAGPKDNKGCPWKDTDGDGVLDKDDNCIYLFGTILNMGCPEKEVTQEVQKTLNDFARTILFDSGKASILMESNSVLMDIVEILKEYPSSGFTIEGHTDSTGGDELNRELSRARANAVKEFLVKNGIDTNRLLTVGHGESRPVETNRTPEGRAKNRRVEINLIK